MATLAPLSTPSRQPFGVLNETKLRNLQSVKNRQNAITPNSAPSLKRRAPSPGLSDSENVDPNVIDSYGKRKRAAFDDDVSLSKPSRYSVHVVPSASKPYVKPSIVTPHLETLQKPVSGPQSAPAAAGRSPTRGKKMGILKPGKRFTPPAYGSKSSISISAALKGTLANKRAKKQRTIEESKPASWSFDIFEESEEQQDYRMNEWTMTQCANILDISDDEGKAMEKKDRGKENIDPNEVSVPVTRSVTTSTTEISVPKATRKDMMTDEPRTPLGDLNASEFYGDGLDATSVVLVHEDRDAAADETSTVEPIVEQLLPSSTTQSQSDFTFTTESRVLEPIDTSDISGLLASSTPIWTDTSVAVEAEQNQISQPVVADPLMSISGGGESVDIDIWESESAKDENENENESSTSTTTKLLDECRGFALQEL